MGEGGVRPGFKPEGSKGGGGGIGCLKIAGIGCLVLVVLGAIGGVVLYFKAADWARSALAMAAEEGGKALLEGLEIPADEREAAMAPIRRFAQDIRDDKVSIDQGVAVAQALSEGPAVAAIMARGFEVKYVKSSELTDEEKQEAHITLTRFAHGITTERIDRKKADEIGDIVGVKTSDGQGNTKMTFKETITTEELNRALAIMKDAADEAGIEEKEFKVDLAAEIQKAIDKGMAKGAAQPAGD